MIEAGRAVILLFETFTQCLRSTYTVGAAPGATSPPMQSLLLSPRGSRHARLSMACAALSLLGGCAVGPDYHAPTAAALGVPTLYSSAPDNPRASDLSTWWETFHDPLLTRLIAEATAGNLDIAISEARLRQARESLVQARGTLLPSVTGSAGFTRNESYGHSSVVIGSGDPATGGSIVRTGGGHSNQFSTGLDASWQADIFGGSRRSVEAARANRDAALFNLVAVTRGTSPGDVWAGQAAVAPLRQAVEGCAADVRALVEAVTGWTVLVSNDQ